MNLHNLLNPTKEKLYSFAILIVGLSLPKVVDLLLTIFVAGTFGTEKYVEYLMFKTSSVPFILATIVIHLVWIYLLVTIIVNICGKSSCEKSTK